MSDRTAILNRLKGLPEKDINELIRAAAKDTLEQMGPSESEAVRRVIERLSVKLPNAGPFVSTYIAVALGALLGEIFDD